ncbi:DNA repair exonuclease [Sulfurimonas lithotrophica]|uniref:DNA repair exonuclease n=1 Tax=Sulfurimonas lithotrophica TaxID=2590022 RepID=A0A5P8P0F3_9BACT|nr:DNA repair exonuclease [Sulfurimonas lithotrophica]QFR49196.1 DNA repair exonuclease [Sulfurimonas lithotrophica]
MKIVHFSDTHLGFNDLDILNEKNINQREADFYDAFSQVLEQIKTIKPDYIIHTGDLFHRASPSNRAITFALEKFKIIDELNIPFILIAGNHSTPRTNLSSPILKIFNSFKNIHVSYNQVYKKIEFKDVAFHTLPHMNDDTKALSQIELCEKSIDENKKNIMMMHCSVGAHYLMQEFGEWVYPKDKEYIFAKMDYVALGHWHGFGQVGKHENVYYSGSTERTSLNDKRNSKGFIELTLEDKASLFGSLDVEYKEIDIRPIITKEIDCEDYENSLASIDVSDTTDAIVEVKLKNLTPMQSIEIQNSDIKEHIKDAMSVNIKREFKHATNESDVSEVEAMSLEEFFLEHIKEDAKEQEYDRLKNKIQELFASYEEVQDDTN